MTTHYIVAAYLGPRRLEDDRHEIDRLFFLREHMASLVRLEHDLDRVTVVVATDARSREWDRRIMDVVPTQVRQTPVDVIYRPNDVGLSYTAMLHAAKDSDAEYILFNEDDYLFAVDHFDRFLVDQMSAHPDVSLVCACVRKGGGDHAAVSSGIVRTADLDFTISLANGDDGDPAVPQRRWSVALQTKGEITDWLHHYPCAYWQDGGTVRWLERPRGDELGILDHDDAMTIEPVQFDATMLLPVQALDRDVYIHYWKHEIYQYVRRLGQIDRAGHVTWKGPEGR